MAAPEFPIKVPLTLVDRFSASLGRVGGALEGFGKKSEKIGKKLSVAITAPLTALGALAAKTGVDYDRALNKASAITGATTAELEALLKSAEETLGAQGIPSLARETAGAVSDLARGGRDLADVQAMLPGVVALATASIVDEHTAAKAATDVLDAWRFSSAEAARVTDVLALAAARGEQGLEGTAEGLTAAGQAAQETGQDFESTAAILNVLADSGQEGAAGAGLFNRALKLLQDPSGETAKTLLRLKVSTKDLFRDDGKLRNLDEILVLLNEHGATARDAIGLFGKSGLALAAILGPGTAKVTEFADKLRGAGGAAVDIAKVQLGGSVGAVREFTAAWESFLVTIARSGLLEGLGEVAHVLAGMLETFNKLPAPMRKTVLTVGALAAALGPVLVGLGTFARVAGSVLSLGGAGAGGLAGGAGGLTLGRAGMVGAGLALGSAHRKVETPGLAGALARVAQRGLGTKRLQAAAGGGAPGANVSGSVSVEFQNAPPGTRVRARSTGDVPIDVDMGASLAGGL